MTSLKWIAWATSSLPVPGLAGDQHVARRRRHARDPLEDVLHPRTSAQQVVVGVFLLEPAPQVGHFVDQPAIFQRLVHHNFEPHAVDRLLDQVVGAQLHRLDRRLDRGIPGHHDDRHRQLALADLADQLQPADPGQAKVGQHQRAGVFHQPFQRSRAVGGDRDLPVGMGEQLRELLADQLAVFHHKDASIHGALIRVEVGGLYPECTIDARRQRRARMGRSFCPTDLALSDVDYADFPGCQAAGRHDAVRSVRLRRTTLSVAIKELIGLFPHGLGKSVLGVGIDRDQTVGNTEQLVDRPGGRDAYSNTIDVKVGVVERRIGEERARRRAADQLGEVKRHLSEVEPVSCFRAGACSPGATSRRCCLCNNGKTH